MNNVQLIGRLTSDPTLNIYKGDKAVSKFTVAIQREYNRDEADFIRCTAFGKQAEVISEHFFKGKTIAIKGHIQTGSYECEDGQTVYTTDIIVDSFYFVGDVAPKQEQKKKKSYSKR